MAKRSRRPARPAPWLEELEDRVVPTLLGQQLFPSDYPWNQNISNAPVAANSAAVIAHIGNSVGIHPDWGEDSPSNGDSPLYGIPVNVVHGNAAGVTKVNFVIDNYPGESDLLPVPMPANPVIEGDYQNGPNLNGPGYGEDGNPNQRGDSHLLIYDVDNNVAYELYGVTRPGDPTLFPNNNDVELPHTDGLWHAAQETVWNMASDSFRSLGETSADAAGLSILAGLARPDEGLPTSQGGQGAIDHALRFTLPSSDVNPQYIYPASHVVNESSASDKLPFGSRLRLMDTPAVNAVIATLGPEAQVLAHAMQQYGLVLADIGSAMYVTGASASVDASNNIQLTWDMDDVLGLHALTASDFQVVNLTPQVTGLSAGSGAAGSTITVVGQNFSGAAGHLTVLFGNTPSPSVTFVDDSHLTAVVPAGSGTVAVQVQSGVVATDPNNPADNVNNPVFGYGVSATSAADQFTYTGRPVSAANSTAGFASPTVASGGADLLTLAVVDTAGNPVTGLASAAFGFSLSGGSKGAFGPVTGTATPGTYTTSFTGATAGGPSTLAVTVAGVTLTEQPTVQVTVGPVSGTRTTAAFASATVAFGGTDTLTLVVQDAAGNAITGLLGSAFGLSLTGGSTGSFGPVTETAKKGTYTATFTGTGSETAGTLTVTVSGVTLSARPTVTVGPPPSHPSGPISTTQPAFNWPAVSGAAGYELYLVDQTTGANPALVVPNITGNTYQLGAAQALTPGDSYTWYVGAQSTNGTPAFSNGLSFSVAPLTAPTPTGPSGSIAAAAGYDTPALTWDAVPGANHYVLYVLDDTTGAAAVSGASAAGTATSYTVASGLTPGHHFTWYVAAATGDNSEVVWSSPQNFTLASYGSPTVTGPGGAVAAANGYDTPTFTWDAVTGANHYLIYLVDAAAPSSPLLDYVSVSGTSYTSAVPLTPGHGYTYFVAAASANNAFTAWSTSQTFTLGTYGSPAVTGPGGTVAAANGYATPTFTWGAVTGADHYLIYLVDDAAPGSPLLDYVSVSGTTYTSAVPLTPGHGYTYFVAAASANNAFTAWGTAQAFTLGTYGKPAVTGPGGTVAAANGYATPTFTWGAVTGADHYLIYLVDDAAPGSPLLDYVSVSGTTYTSAVPLTPGHGYTYFVAAASANNAFMAWSTSQTFTLGTYGKPTVTGPSGALAPTSGYDTPTLTWNAVAGANHYLICLVDEAAPGSPVLNYVSVPGTSYTVSQGLTPGHAYTYFVAAASAGNAFTAWSSSQAFTLGTYGKPTVTGPSGTLAATSGYDTPTLTWNAVAGANHYVLYLVDAAAPNSPVLDYVSVTGTSYTVSQGLTPGHGYTFDVAAASANTAYTAWSLPQNFTLASMSAPAVTGPSGTVAAAAGYDTPTFTWNAVAGASRYTVCVIDDTTGAAAVYTTVTGTS
jgi:hypothetical protein